MALWLSILPLFCVLLLHKTKLAQALGPDKVARLVSKAAMKKRDKEKDPQLKTMMIADVLLIPRLGYEIVVTTMSLSAHLGRLGLGYFNRLFIDEASQASEPEVLVPLNIVDPDRCKVVMAGDPHQLGPYVKTDELKAMGREVSMFERLMGCEPYKRNPRNPWLITKLVQNYRSHRKLLTVPSRLFYDDELEACSPRKSVSAQPVLQILPWAPKSTFPLIWHDVQFEHTKDMRPPRTSLYNTKEIQIVVLYVRHLIGDGGNREGELNVLPSGIGILSPYKAQVRAIEDALNEAPIDTRGILVGTTERFQVSKTF